MGPTGVGKYAFYEILCACNVPQVAEGATRSDSRMLSVADIVP
jgi:hypothetical protein